MVRYFDLGIRPDRGAGCGSCLPALSGEGKAGEEDGRPVRCRSPLHTAGHYVSLTLGVLAKQFTEASTGWSEFNWTTVITAAILAAVSFPYVYKKVCDPSRSDPVEFFISFQSGFFFQTILEQVRRML
jgi:hypothetical protein